MDEEEEEEEFSPETPETLQTLCIAEIVGRDVWPFGCGTTLRERDVKSVILQLTTPELKYNFLDELWCCEEYELLLTYLLHWSFILPILKKKGSDYRVKLLKAFQGCINELEEPIHLYISNDLEDALECGKHHSVKGVYEIMLFTAFLQEAGWFAQSEKLLNALFQRIEQFYITENELHQNDDTVVKYYGPFKEKLPKNVKNRKTIYSAYQEIKILLITSLVNHPSCETLPKAEALIQNMTWDEKLLSHMKQIDVLALKISYSTICSTYHQLVGNQLKAYHCSMRGLKKLMEYTESTPHTEEINPKIIIDCLKQTSKVLLNEMDYMNAEILMEVAMNITKQNYTLWEPYYGEVLLDYGLLLRVRERFVKGIACFQLAHKVRYK